MPVTPARPPAPRRSAARSGPVAPAKPAKAKAAPKTAKAPAKAQPKAAAKATGAAKAKTSPRATDVAKHPAKAKAARTPAKTPKKAPTKPKTSTKPPAKARTSKSVARSGGTQTPPSIAPRDRVVVSSAQRFAERAKERRRVTLRKAGALVTALVAAAAVGWVVFYSPVLGLDPHQVVVKGTKDSPVAEADVRAVVDHHAAEPLPRLDTAALCSQLRAVHGVKDVQVVRDWPRGLTVTVTPRVAVAVVPDGDQVALVDPEGVRLGTGPDPPPGLPLVQADGDRALAAALSVVVALPPDLALQVATITAPTQDTVSLALTDGVEVLWGSGEDNALKAQVVATLRADETITDVTTIDVSAPRRPVLR